MTHFDSKDFLSFRCGFKCHSLKTIWSSMLTLMIAKKKIDFFVEEKVYLNRLLILHFIYEKDSSLLNLFAQHAQCVSLGNHRIL